MAVGCSIARFDDIRLLTGYGKYTDDYGAPGQVHCAFVRSVHANADIVGIDRTAVASHPGVLGVFTSSDLADDGIRAIAPGLGLRAREHPNRDGSMMVELDIPILARDRVRFVGEPIAMVVAMSIEAARDAAERVSITYAPRPAVVACAEALRPGAPVLWEEVPGNLVFDYATGDEVAVKEALAAACHVVETCLIDNRLAVCFTEPRGALATYDHGTGRYHLVAGVQSVHGIARSIAGTLGVDGATVRVTSPDTGGGFGGRSVLYPEYVAVLWAARHLRRPVKWNASREEEFQATTQGRDGLLTGRLGLDADGRMTALGVEAIAALGARHAGNGPFSTMRNLERMLAGVYEIPAIHFHQRGVFTNTTPISSYRGVGRVEASYLIERLAEKAARHLGLDRLELRRLNAIKSGDLPKRTAMGALYDSGDYAGNMELARAAGGWDGFESRRQEAAARGMLRGMAICNYIEGAGGGAGEYACVSADAEGRISVAVGCVDQGQGHSTVMRQVAAHVLGLEPGALGYIGTDTLGIKDGVGTNASRSMVRAGKAVAEAATALIEAGRLVAARLLQSEPQDLKFANGSYHVPGTGKVTSIAEVARLSEHGLSAEVRHFDETVTYPNGCHFCEVEVDPETGLVTILRYIAIDDVGRAVNPMIVRGQSHGGIAQGIGQAVMEQVRYDVESGQLLTGSFMDYPIPRASDLPWLETIANDHPSPFTRLGIKGAGEGGATGAPATAISAILHALEPLCVGHIDMPATSQNVWRAIQAARSSDKRR